MKDFNEYLDLIYSEECRNELHSKVEELAERVPTETPEAFALLRNDLVMDYKLMKYHEWLNS